MEFKEKIKVFISSKCGGERINFDKIVDSDLKDKKSLANSAVRTNYDIVRKSLKSFLESTGFITVYIFEDGAASTLSAKEEYLYEIDSSDVCLFLIDNFDDNISPGVLTEIQRAKSQKRKSIYLFLNDPNREETLIQKNFTGENGDRYQVIDDIREFIDEGLNSVILDILRIYRLYCRGGLARPEATPLSIEITSEIFPAQITDIEKQLFSNLGMTKNKITSLVYKLDERQTQTSDLDKVCLQVLEFLLGERQFAEIDLTFLLRLLEELQPPDLHGIVKQRWSAISSLWSNDLDTSLKVLESLSAQLEERSTVSKWLISDILIDWRNLSFIKTNAGDVFDYPIQKKIDQQHSMIYFPLADRFSTNIANDILERNFNAATSSPYSSTIYSIESAFKEIPSYLLVAIYYGSYTHIVLALREIHNVLVDLIQKNNNLSTKIQLMRISVLRGGESDFKKVMGKYKCSLSHSTSKEVVELYKLAEAKPTTHERTLWKIILFRELGYYFSDDDYETVLSEMKDFLSAWIHGENQSVRLMDKFIEAIIANKERIPLDQIIDFSTDILERKYYRFFDSVFDLLARLDISIISLNSMEELISSVSKVLEDEKVKKENLHNVKRLLAMFGKRFEKASLVDEIVKKYYPEFYDKDYHLEVRQGERAVHIPRYIEVMKSRNEVQGKGGQFIGFVDRPYETISNIIEFDQVSLSEEVLGRLLDEIRNTLLSKTQTYSEKINAIHLLLLLKHTSGHEDYNWIDYYASLKRNVDTIKTGHSGFFEQESDLSLRFAMAVLQFAFNDTSWQEMFEILALINNESEREVIDSLITLYYFLKRARHLLAEDPFLPVIVQYVSTFCFHESQEIRRQTVGVLYQLLNTQYADFAAGRLSKMMNDDDFGVKLPIVRQVDLLKQKDFDAYNYILSKANIDNHYLVRRVAKSIEEKDLL